MAFASSDMILDVDICNPEAGEYELLYYGAPHTEVDVSRSEYRDRQRILRWYAALMGEARPQTSALSVDIASDEAYRVYRYDWVLGLTCLGAGPAWDWQTALRGLTVHLVMDPGDSGFRCTCVTADLKVLPPSRDNAGGWQRNRRAAIDALTASTQFPAAAPATAGNIAKAVAAMTTSLEADGEGRANWYVHQFLDDRRRACGVEWRIDKEVMRRHGPVLRGSLVLAFHGGGRRSEERQRGIDLIFRPQLGFQQSDLACIAPTDRLQGPEGVHLEVLPQAPAE